MEQRILDSLQISIHSLRVEGDLRRLTKPPQTGDFNPLPPCGGRPFLLGVGDYNQNISIHSLRVEGDAVDISTTVLVPEFQSTPSVWRETRKPLSLTMWKSYFNPLPPCGGRRGLLAGSERKNFYFNPLPPCGGRLRNPNWRIPTIDFNPLPPCGGRHYRFDVCKDSFDISIHSLRVEGDTWCNRQ